MIIEKPGGVAWETQAVILLSYFSSVTTHFVHVLSKWHHPAQSPEDASGSIFNPLLKYDNFLRTNQWEKLFHKIMLLLGFILLLDLIFPNKRSCIAG